MVAIINAIRKCRAKVDNTLPFLYQYYYQQFRSRVGMRVVWLSRYRVLHSWEFSEAEVNPCLFRRKNVTSALKKFGETVKMPKARRITALLLIGVRS